jgi:hypothetical protein
VCLGVVARGGGRRGVLRPINVSSTSGAEPMQRWWLVMLCQTTPGIRPNASVYVLSCNSIALELEVPCAFFSGEVGDEKMPAMGSMPCSSRTPVSIKTIPVLLSRRQYCQYCPRLRKPNSPTNFAHVKVLVASPPSTPRRVAPDTLPSIFCRIRSSHAARNTVFLLGIQRVGLSVVSPAVLCAARSIQVSVRAKKQYQCWCPIREVRYPEQRPNGACNASYSVVAVPSALSRSRGGSWRGQRAVVSACEALGVVDSRS